VHPSRHRRGDRRCRNRRSRTAPVRWFAPFVRFALVLAAVAWTGTACAGGETDPPRDAGQHSAIRVASFDFPSSRVLAELYAAALRRDGYPVELVLGLGTREVVGPALVQGHVDVVPEYAGALLGYMSGTAVPREPAAVLGALRGRLEPRRLAVLAPAPAQEQNGFAVTAARARADRLRTLSDLTPHARSLVLGAPPECPQRPFCLPGLERTYGLHFAAFQPMASRAVTAEALRAGEIHVGLLETTAPWLADGRLVLLADDRGLQPPENVVPVVRQQVLDHHGQALARTLDAVSAQLTTPGLAAANRRAEIDGVRPADVAAEWLRAHPSPSRRR
jgi:osmoprotectant transport system substrate-binding protein